MDEENQINDKLKIMKFSLLPCGLKHTVFYYLQPNFPNNNNNRGNIPTQVTSVAIQWSLIFKK